MKDPIRILLIASDPKNRTRLRLGEELQKIKDEIERSRHAERFNLDEVLSTQIEDMSRAVLSHNPRIIHFSGHGSSDGALCFEDQNGQAHPVSPEALERFFRAVSDQVECVLLNSCYSAQQAEVIVKYIPYVIGMRRVVTDEAATRFSVGFYQALANGRSYSKAFEFGCLLVETNTGEELQAELRVAPDAEAKLATKNSENSETEQIRSEPESSSRAINSTGAVTAEKVILQGNHGTVNQG